MKTQHHLPKLAIAIFTGLAVTSALGSNRSLAATKVSPLFVGVASPLENRLHFYAETSLSLAQSSDSLQNKSIVLVMKKCTIKRYRRPH
ncbi:hypothetical protein [Chamaesiphon sp. GL140_3_metabinner_50]|uniref:hypothetical protein n=1 Tax=Chamaesiphon sp. GL140_3_metabinner_50 TaxID=2970812 RepID=UPI0025E31DAD|nr:hypothetical protein [Chamaesiphon sp. GL140_3_metabinner_50]